MQKIVPFLWFDDNAQEAAKFYTSIFNNSKILNTSHYGKESEGISGKKAGSVMTVEFKIKGYDFVAINGGPIFKINPSISFFVNCKTSKEVDALFTKLSSGGEIMMPLDKYPFNDRYAFFKDKFNISWQIMIGENESIVPCFLFVGESLGKAKEAVDFYKSIFKDSKLKSRILYKKGQNGKEGTVMFSSFNLENQEFSAMDGQGPHKFSFNEAISFLVNCEDQTEIDYLWGKLTKDGQESQCGWLKDKFNISWQITPKNLREFIAGKDKAGSARAMQAMFKMQKINIDTLKKAYNKN